MKIQKRTLVILIVALLVIGWLVYTIVDAQITAKRQAEAEQLDKDVAMEVLGPYLEKYGFEDMVCNSVDYQPSYVEAVVTSQSFGEAADEVKLAFLADLEYLPEQMLFSSKDSWRLSYIKSSGLTLKVISGEYSYTETVDDGKSELRRAKASDAYVESMYSPYKEVVLRMETEHAKDVEESLEKLTAKDKCTLCNATGAVKYYYGGSDMEAYLDGHEPSWYGQCPSCDGKGSVYRYP